MGLVAMKISNVILHHTISSHICSIASFNPYFLSESYEPGSGLGKGGGCRDEQNSHGPCPTELRAPWEGQNFTDIITNSASYYERQVKDEISNDSMVT